MRLICLCLTPKIDNDYIFTVLNIVNKTLQQKILLLTLRIVMLHGISWCFSVIMKVEKIHRSGQLNIVFGYGGKNICIPLVTVVNTFYGFLMFNNNVHQIDYDLLTKSLTIENVNVKS